MFFVILFSAPVLVGLVAGVWTAHHAIPWRLAALSVALGIAWAAYMGITAEAQYRGENVAFALFAGVAGAALVWVGYALGRISRRSGRTA